MKLQDNEKCEKVFLHSQAFTEAPLGPKFSSKQRLNKSFLEPLSYFVFTFLVAKCFAKQINAKITFMCKTCVQYLTFLCSGQMPNAKLALDKCQMFCKTNEC